MNNSECNSYDALHTKLRKIYGKAQHCSICSIKNKKSYQWALITGKNYSLNIEDYIPLCSSCHKKYDYTDEMRLNNSKSKKGIPREYCRIKVVLNDSEVFDSLTIASIEKGILKSSIANNLSGLSKKTKVGVWKYYK